MPVAIDPEGVRRYFDEVGASAAAASYMAHTRRLPPAAAVYRKELELAALADWLDAVPATGRVLDAGCGAGNWGEVFAARYRHVTCVDQSRAMLDAARKRLAGRDNVEILEADIRRSLPGGPFDLVFLGGVCMYLGDEDAAALVKSALARLSPGRAIILRESTVRRETRVRTGGYQAVYRTVEDYRLLFDRAGGVANEIRQNRGYERFEIAADIADLVPGRASIAGPAVWGVLRAAAPISFWLLPRLTNALGIERPRLQNHFFRVGPR